MFFTNFSYLFYLITPKYNIHEKTKRIERSPSVVNYFRSHKRYFLWSLYLEGNIPSKSAKMLLLIKKNDKSKVRTESSQEDLDQRILDFHDQNEEEI